MIHCQRCGRPIPEQERQFDGRPDVYCDICSVAVNATDTMHLAVTTEAPGLLGGTVRRG